MAYQNNSWWIKRGGSERGRTFHSERGKGKECSEGKKEGSEKNSKTWWIGRYNMERRFYSATKEVDSRNMLKNMKK